MNIASILRKVLKLLPDQETVVHGELRLPYPQVGKRVGRLAADSNRPGLKTRDYISIIALIWFEVLESVPIRGVEAETISLIGANGAVKSTLVKAITASLPCREGKIIYYGIGLTSYALDNLLVGSYCRHRKNE